MWDLLLDSSCRTSVKASLDQKEHEGHLGAAHLKALKLPGFFEKLTKNSSLAASN